MTYPIVGAVVLGALTAGLLFFLGNTFSSDSHHSHDSHQHYHYHDYPASNYALGYNHPRDYRRKKKDERCTICLELFLTTSRVAKVLPCYHIFHTDCIDKWFSSGSKSCPNCRHQN